jgi:hypothetical protein
VEIKIDEARVKKTIIEMWARGGGDTPIKIMSAGLVPRDDLDAGFITQLKFLRGRTPAQMEDIVGFRAGTKLRNGVDIYKLSVLPRPDQFMFRGYSYLSGGISSSEKPFHPDYPPGLGCPQWELIHYPQTRLVLLQSVPDGQVFHCTDKAVDG